MLVNAYCTHRTPPPLSFPHRLNARRDRSDPDLANHLNGFMGFVMDGGKRPMTQMRYAVIRHLERVRHHLSIDVEDMDAFAAWAEEANAIVFVPDGTVRAPDGAVLVSPTDGEPEEGARIPYPADAVARKAATDAKLAALGIRVPATLPPVVSEVEVELRSAADVASRALALFACALRGESIASGKELPSADIETRVPRAKDAMSPRERAFFGAASPEKQEVVDHVWRYEALAVLVWSLGLSSELAMPTAIVDVPALAKTMLEAKLEAPSLRATREILDALDLHFRLHWAVTDARIKKTAPPAKLEPGVVAERHYALNWLTRFEDADWDDVQTPT